MNKVIVYISVLLALFSFCVIADSGKYVCYTIEEEDKAVLSEQPECQGELVFKFYDDYYGLLYRLSQDLPITSSDMQKSRYYLFPDSEYDGWWDMFCVNRVKTGEPVITHNLIGPASYDEIPWAMGRVQDGEELLESIGVSAHILDVFCVIYLPQSHRRQAIYYVTDNGDYILFNRYGGNEYLVPLETAREIAKEYVSHFPERGAGGDGNLEDIYDLSPYIVKERSSRLIPAVIIAACLSLIALLAFVLLKKRSKTKTQP